MMSERQVTLALVQMPVVDGQPGVNRSRARAAIAQAAAQGAQVVLLPEMWTTGFVVEPGPLAEAVPGGPTTRALQTWARRYGVWVLGSLLERDPVGGLYNTAVAIGPQGQVWPRYRKIHLFGGMDEGRFLQAGCCPRLWAFPWARVGVLVCYDVRFPELARTYALAGAEMLVVLAAWPAARRAHWDVLLQARAVENLLFVAAVNRVGDGRFGPYGGGSAVLDPWGRVRVRASAQAGLWLARVAPGESRRRRAAFSALADRRPECYGPERLDCA